MTFLPVSRGRLLGASLCLCAACGGAGTTLQAQEVKPESGLPAKNEFHVLGSVGERRSSNVFFDPEDGSPQSDYITTLQLTFAARRHSPRTAWSLNYTPLYSHYMDISDLDSSSHAFDADATYNLNERSTLVLGERFSLSRDPLLVAAPEAGDVAILTDSQQRSRNSTNVDLNMAVSRSIGLLFGVQYDLNRFDNPLATDSDSYVGRMAVSGKVGREDTLTGGYSFSVLRLEPPEPVFTVLNPVVTQNRDTTAHELGMGWGHAAEHWGTDLFVAYSLADQHQQDFDASGVIDDRHDDNRLFTGRAALRRFFRRVALNGGYQRRLTADTGADVVTIGDSVFLDVNGNIGLHMTYGMTLDAGSRKSVGGSSERDLDFEGATLRGGYAFTEWCSLSATAHVRKQVIHEPTPGTQRVDSYFVGLTFKIY